MTTDPKQCPNCGLRPASSWVRQLMQSNLRMYPDEIVQKQWKTKGTMHLMEPVSTSPVEIAIELSMHNVEKESEAAVLLYEKRGARINRP